MSFLGGIFNTVKDVVSSVGDFASGGLVSGGLDLVGGIMTNSANAAQAKKQMEFQADQTGTAYQRAVADLKAAGLNPMLAYTNGGAASGSGASAVMQNAVGHAVNTGMAAKANNAQVQNLSATVDKTRNDIVNNTAATQSQIQLNRLLGIKAAADAKLSATSAASVASGLPEKQLKGDFWSSAGDIVRQLGNPPASTSHGGAASKSSPSITRSSDNKILYHGVPLHSDAF